MKTENRNQIRAGETTIADQLPGKSITAIVTDAIPNERIYVRPKFARFKFAWKTPEGKLDSRMSYDFNHRVGENEKQALIDLREWGMKKKIDSCECFTATIYATLSLNKSTSEKNYDCALFHWLLRRGKWEVQETEEIHFFTQNNKLDLAWHRNNRSTIQFGRTVTQPTNVLQQNNNFLNEKR